MTHAQCQHQPFFPISAFLLKYKKHVGGTLKLLNLFSGMPVRKFVNPCFTVNVFSLAVRFLFTTMTTVVAVIIVIYLLLMIS
jgi:hypothetical protein